MMTRLLICLLAGCSAKSAPPPTPPTPPPVVTPAPKPAGTPFGRYTIVPPAGYQVEAREIEIGFRREDILIVAMDGAEMATPPPDKCEGQLAAFTTGVVTGLARAETHVTIASSKLLANGCRLTGTIPTGMVEAAVVDLGLAGPAVAFLVHTRADDGASAVFDQVLGSIAKK